MEASELDALGPVDYLVVEFPADKANVSGEMAEELKSLTDRALVRVLDLVLLRKEADGSVEVAELADVEESNVGELLALEADIALLLAEEDVERNQGQRARVAHRGAESDRSDFTGRSSDSGQAVRGRAAS